MLDCSTSIYTGPIAVNTGWDRGPHCERLAIAPGQVVLLVAAIVASSEIEIGDVYPCVTACEVRA